MKYSIIIIFWNYRKIKKSFRFVLHIARREIYNPFPELSVI